MYNWYPHEVRDSCSRLSLSKDCLKSQKEFFPLIFHSDVGVLQTISPNGLKTCEIKERRITIEIEVGALCFLPFFFEKSCSNVSEKHCLGLHFVLGRSPPCFLHNKAILASPPPPNVIYSRFWYTFSWGNSIPYSDLTVTFANWPEPGSLWKRWNFYFRLSAKRILYIFSQIWTVFEPVQGPCTMNVRNEPVHVMACVVKRETTPIWRWRLCEFQHGKSISESGINNIGWRGSCAHSCCQSKKVMREEASFWD